MGQVLCGGGAKVVYRLMMMDHWYMVPQAGVSALGHLRKL
jgi:hypothetical protein